MTHKVSPETQLVNSICKLHHCCKIFWPRLFFIFCQFQNRGIFGYPLSASVLINRSHIRNFSAQVLYRTESINKKNLIKSKIRRAFVLDCSLNRGHRHFFFLRFLSNRTHTLKKIIKLKIRGAFGLSCGLNRGHTPRFCLGYGKNRGLMYCFFLNTFSVLW